MKQNLTGSIKSNYDLDNDMSNNSDKILVKKKASEDRVLLYYDLKTPPYYAEESEAVKILKILNYLKSHRETKGDTWCQAVDLYKELKMPRSTLITLLKMLAGVVRIEYQANGNKKIVFNNIQRIMIKKDSCNKASNIRRNLDYLRAPLMVKLPFKNSYPI